MMHRSDQVRVAAARADFLGGENGSLSQVADVVAASWRRSAQQGVSSDAFDLTYHHDIDTSTRLVRCASPVLDRLLEETSDLALVVALTDKKARILTRRDTSAEIARLFDRINLAPGYEYSEGGIGTNGVGTVLESGRSISVVGAEHFHERLQAYACTGAPIIDPVTGRVEGVLDISSLSERWSPLMHSLVRSAARDIGRNLLVDRSQCQQALFERYVLLDARTHHAVIAVSGAVEMVNATAAAEFTAQERQGIIDEAKLICHKHEKLTATTILSTGRRVQLQCTRIAVGSDVAGVVVVAQLAQGQERADEGNTADTVLRQICTVPVPSTGPDKMRRGPSVVDPHLSKVSAWRKPIGDLYEAVRTQESVLVLGETGVGKFTSVLAFFHQLHPGGRSLVFEPSTFDGQDFDCTDAQALVGAGPTVLVLRNIDQLTTEGVQRAEQLISVLIDSAEHLHIAATLSDAPLDRELPFRQLLPYFSTSVTLPGIRFRTEDIPLIASQILRELAPERDTQIAPNAMSVLCRYSWPRNIIQLREALASALLKRPVGHLTADDLPGYCFSEARRGLTRVERTERDLIVEVLKQLGGNRVKAAEQLGMSRSSLYRKLSRYGIKTI